MVNLIHIDPLHNHDSGYIDREKINNIIANVDTLGTVVTNLESVVNNMGKQVYNLYSLIENIATAVGGTTTAKPVTSSQQSSKVTDPNTGLDTTLPSGLTDPNSDVKIMVGNLELHKSINGGSTYPYYAKPAGSSDNGSNRVYYKVN